MTLLDKALNTKHKQLIHRNKKELQDLAISWAKDEISLTQAGIGLNTAQGSSTYTQLAIGLREAFRDGVIK